MYIFVDTFKSANFGLQVSKTTPKLQHHPLKKPKKENLPTKICAACKRPFTWRKKWERCWDEVLYCSEGCKKKRNN